MRLQTGCVVIGALDLLAVIALYLSPYAYRINPMIALIFVTPSVLLIIGASLKNYQLMWPWLIINWIIELGLAGACVAIIIGSVNRDVGPAGVVLKINEIVFDKKPDFVDVIKMMIALDERSLEENILRTFFIYVACALVLLVVVSNRTSGVNKYKKTLCNEKDQGQAPPNQQTPGTGTMPYTLQIDE